jgi:ribosomal protein S18 acetylase RimI-like enzyme
MKIKRMKHDDLEKHFADFLLLFAENTRGHVQNQKIEDEYILFKAKELMDYLLQEKAILFGAFKCKKLIGFLWSYSRIFLEEKRMYINSLIINNNYRGEGYGKLLIEELEKYAIEKSIYAIDVTTASFKTDAIKFYGNIGFESERVQLKKTLKQ